MSMRQIGVLAVALVAAIAALFIVRGMAGGDKPKEAATTTVQQGGGAIAGPRILVAARALEPGDRAAPSDFTWIAWPQEAVNAAFIAQDRDPKAIEEFAGAVARQPVLQGEPITAEKLVQPGDQGFLAAMLKPGYRAVAVPITEESAAAGFIMPNDHVDVVLTRKTQQAGGENGAMEEVVRSDVILQDVRVLAIDQKYRNAKAEGKDPEAMAGKVATLELSVPDTELLTRANRMGDVSLALRSVLSEPNRMTVSSAARRGAGVLAQGGLDAVRIHSFGEVKETRPASAIRSAQ